ncbi:uncharacterized protein BJ212DRAFT_1289850, partial [Suillus subaureus]
LPDAEVELIVRSIADNLRTYEQIVEVSILTFWTVGSSLLPPHSGGLQPLSFCLFHHQESIREATVDIFNELRQNPYAAGVIFLQALNHFQRYAYVRQAHARESRMKDVTHGLAPATSLGITDAVQPQ